MKRQDIEKYTYYTDDYKKYLETVAKDVQKSPFLPKYHLYPKTGLMNDPNGLSYFNHEYHIFYQWFPFDSTHGMKHWGHVSSNDLVEFKDLGFGIIPDKDYEKNGAYSGNAFEYKGQLYLFYTANYKTAKGKVAKQALAIMDKEGNIVKHKDNPILDGAPSGFSQELRDPFVFERDGKFNMLLGGSRFVEEGRDGFGDKGELLLYQSTDLVGWDYKGTISLPIDTGYMLECPSLVTIEEKDVLFLSPMGYEANGNNYHNRFAAIYLVGNLDLENKCFSVETCAELDAGFDYYAPQSFYGEKGLPISLGWFGCGEQSYPNDNEMWKHGLTMPQELRLKDNTLYRYPVASVRHKFEGVKELVTGKQTIETPYYHFNTTVDRGTNVEFQFGAPSDYWVLRLDGKMSQVLIDRSSLKHPIDEEFGLIRKADLLSDFDKCEVDIFVDNSFIEIYINKGEKVFSFRTFQTVVDYQITYPKDITATIAYFNEGN